MKYFIYIYTLNLVLFIPTISIAMSPIVQNTVTEDAKVTPPQKNCQYFLKTGLENDNWSVLTPKGNDMGYTHGHLTNIIKSCKSGVDIHVIAGSHLFTSDFPRTEDSINRWAVKLRDLFLALGRGDLQRDDIVWGRGDDDAIDHFFEEQNSITVKYTDWRTFNKMYRTARLTLGHLSRNKRFWAGKQQEAFHDSLSPLFDEVNSGESGVFKYGYIDDDQEETFVEGYFALGKSYSLDGSKETCSNECTDYFRMEAGTEFSSLEHGSNISISAEMEIATIWDALSVFASVDAQKNESIDGIYHEKSLGLKLRASPRLQFVYFITKRKLPDDWIQFKEYDWDEDSLAYIGVVFKLNIGE